MTSETQPGARLPFEELLALLRQRGLQVGVRDHLAIARLLDRFEGNLPALRQALTALLSRNSRDAAIIRETFDSLYVPPDRGCPDKGSGPSKRRGVLKIVALLVVVAVAVAAAIPFVIRALRRTQPVRSVDAVLSQRQPGDKRKIPPPPIQKLRDVRPNNRVAIAMAASAGSLLFVCLYTARVRRNDRRTVHDVWSDQAATLPQPADYDLDIGRPGDAFPPDVLDDVARLLNRRTALFRRRDLLDVDRTIEETLRAGFAPRFVMRSPRATTPIVVLEDLAEGGRPWQWRTRSLLHGLERRGVPIEWWQFNGDASTVRSLSSGATVALATLVRLRAESPLVVISSGDAVLAGDPPALPAWIRSLVEWQDRVWVHPVPDPRYWRESIRMLPCNVFPMTAQGLLAAAREVSHGSTFARQQPWINSEERPVTPLDSDRLRWLVALAPRRDAHLLEVLRRRFFPGVPLMAVGIAFEAPRMQRQLTVGPDAAVVHETISDILGRSSRTPHASGGGERLRLDVALQQVHVQSLREAAVEELRRIAAGPLIMELLDALQRAGVRRRRRVAAPGSFSVATKKAIRLNVLPDVRRRARMDRRLAGSAQRIIFPSLRALAAAAALALTVVVLAPRSLRRTDPPDVRIGYQLQQSGGGTGSFQLEVRHAPDVPTPPPLVELYRDKTLIQRDVDLRPVAVLRFNDAAREHWYYVRAIAGERTVFLSRPFYVQRSASAVRGIIEPPIVRPPLGTLNVRFVDQNGRSVGAIVYRLRVVGSGQDYVGAADVNTRVLAGIYDVTIPDLPGISGASVRVIVKPGAVLNITVPVQRTVPEPPSVLFDALPGTYVLEPGTVVRLEGSPYCEGSQPGPFKPTAENFQTEVVITREGRDLILTMKGVGGEALPQLNYRLKPLAITSNVAVFTAGDATAPWSFTLACGDRSVNAHSSGQVRFVRERDRISLTGQLIFTNDALPTCDQGECRTIYRDLHELNHLRIAASQ
jgi:hypothetical protein